MFIVENLKNAQNIKAKNKSFIIPLFRKQILMLTFESLQSLLVQVHAF